MSSDQIHATARVKVTLDVPAANWNNTITAKELMMVAGTEAVQAVRRLITDKPGWHIVGEPIVTLVTGINRNEQ